MENFQVARRTQGDHFAIKNGVKGIKVRGAKVALTLKTK